MTEEHKEEVLAEEEILTEEEVLTDAADEQEPEGEVAEDPRIAQLIAEKEELNQRFLRVAADFENYKRRTVAEKEDLAKYSTVKLIGELLPVMDNFSLAMKNPGDTPEVQNLYKGVEMIFKQLVQVLEKEGLEQIETVGKQFDPNLHEAIMQVEDDSAEEDTIVEELRAGYKVKDRVIRAAMVKVAK